VRKTFAAIDNDYNDNPFNSVIIAGEESPGMIKRN